MHFQVALLVKNPPASAGDIRDSGLILWSGRSPGEGNGNPLQYSCLENPMDRGAWWASVHKGRKESNRTEMTQHIHITGREQSFQQLTLEQMDIHMEKDEFGPLLHTMYKTASKQTNINIRANTIRLLEESIGVNLYDPGLGNGFLDKMPKSTSNKRKKNRLTGVDKNQKLFFLRMLSRKQKGNSQNE